MSGNSYEPNSPYTVDEFTRFLGEFDIHPSTPLLADGALHRCHVQGHAVGSRNLAYVLHDDEHPAGWFQEFKSGIAHTWRHQDDQPRAPVDRERLAAQRRQREQQALQKQERIARVARLIWDRAQPAPAAHPYLTRKGVKAHGLRVSDWRIRYQVGPERWAYRTVPNTLLVPLRDASGVLWNLQGIFPAIDGELGRDKTFLPGRKQGLLHWIGRKSDTLMLCEGYATAATVFEATGLQTFIAFDAGNLLPVALTLRSRRPEARIVVCGDNDHQTPGNPGLTAAERAAEAVAGWLSVPTFPPGCPGSDWNDAAKMEHAHD